MSSFWELRDPIIRSSRPVVFQATESPNCFSRYFVSLVPLEIIGQVYLADNLPLIGGSETTIMDMLVLGIVVAYTI